MMKPAGEIHELAPDLIFWQTWSPEAKVELGCTALVLGGELVFIDPVPLAEPLLVELARRFPPRAIVLTNGNHERASAQFGERFGIPRYAHGGAAAVLEAEHQFDDGAMLFGALQVISLPGAAAGEVALYHATRELLVVGDALINLDSTGLITLPPKYCEDAPALARSLKKLLAISLQTITFAHGLPIVHQASQRIAGVLAEA